MTKLTYANDQQIIADAAQSLIETHLQWSGSQKEMPSRDLDCVQGQVLNAYLKARLTIDEWKELTEDEQNAHRAKAELIFTKAAQLADRKWEAVMTLLGIEQR